MASDDRSGKYPDISGVFDIDDNEVPTKILLRKQEEDPARAEVRSREPVLFRQTEGRGSRSAAYEREQSSARGRAEAHEKARKAVWFSGSEPETESASPRRESVLLRREDPAEDPAARQEKLQAEAQRRARRKEALRKKRRKILFNRLVLVCVLAAVLVAGVAVFRASRRPTVRIARVTDTPVQIPCTVTAVTLTASVDGGTERLYAVAVLDAEQERLIQEKNSVELTYQNGSTATGSVYDVRKEGAESGLLEAIGALLPDFSVPPEGCTVALILQDDANAVVPDSVVSANVFVQTSESALSVPVNALRTDGLNTYVWVYSAKGLSKKLERRMVNTGLISDTNAEIVNGLEKGEAVVIGASLQPDQLKDGMKVQLEKSK